MPRAALLNDMVHERIVNACRGGSPLKHAAAMAGVSERSVHRYIERGERYWSAIEAGEVPNADDEPFARFAADVDEARAAARVHAVATVVSAFTDDWRAAAWFLERTLPAEFGRRVVVEADEAEQGEASLDAMHAQALALVAEVERRRSEGPVDLVAMYRAGGSTTEA